MTTDLEQLLLDPGDLPEEDILQIRDTFCDLDEAMDGATPRQVYNEAVRVLPGMLGFERATIKRVVLAVMGYDKPPAPT